MATKAGEKRAATSALGGAQKRARHGDENALQQRMPEMRQSRQSDEFLPASFSEFSAEGASSAWDAWADEPLPDEAPLSGLSAREQEIVACREARPPEIPNLNLIVRENDQPGPGPCWEDMSSELWHHIIAMMDPIARSYFISASKTTYADVTVVRDRMGRALDDRYGEFGRVRAGVRSEQQITSTLLKSLTEGFFARKAVGGIWPGVGHEESAHRIPQRRTASRNLLRGTEQCHSLAKLNHQSVDKLQPIFRSCGERVTQGFWTRQYR